MSSWRLYDVTGATYYDMSDGIVRKQLDGLNMCENITIFNAGLPDDREVKIYDPDDNVIFHGFTKRKTSESNSTIEKYNIYQLAHELLGDMVSDGDYDVTYANQTVNDTVDDILTGTGWTRGSSDAAILDYVSFKYRKKLTALYDVLRDQRGHNIWFNDATKTVYFGVNNTNRTGTPTTYINKVIKRDTDKRNVNKVVVVGGSSNIVGIAGTGTPVVAYKYDNLINVSEATRIATQLLSVIGSTKQQVTIGLDSIDTFYEEGDLVRVDAVDYTVFNVKIKMDSITLILDAGVLNINDLFEGKLHEISGTFIIGENSISSFDGGEQNIGTTVLARYRIQVDNINLVNSFKLVGKLGNWKKSLATGLEGTGLGVDQDYALPNNVPNSTGLWINTDWALPDNTPNDTGLSVDDETDIPINTYNVYVKNTSLPLNWVSVDIPFNSGFSSFAWTTVHGSITIEATAADESVWLELQYKIGAVYYTAGATQTIVVKNGTRLVIPISAIGPGSTTSGSQTWRMKATSSSGNGDALNASLFCGFIGRHDHSTTENNHDHASVDLGHDHNATESNHDHDCVDAGHDHNTTETDHEHPETDNMAEINNYPADVIIKVNGVQVGLWPGAIHDQTLTVADIKAQLNTGLNEITVESTKAASIYLGGEVEMILI